MVSRVTLELRTGGHPAREVVVNLRRQIREMQGRAIVRPEAYVLNAKHAAVDH